MSRYVTEFAGTFFLVLTIGLVVLDGTPMAPIARKQVKPFTFLFGWKFGERVLFPDAG